MVKAIVLDIDGTLLTHNQCKIEQSTIEAINLAHQKGIKIIVATGRGYSFMQQDVKDSIKADLYVCCNGGVINDSNGKVLLQKPLYEDTVEKFISYSLDHEFSFGFKTGDDFVVYNDYPYFIKHYCTKAILKDNIHDFSVSKDYHKHHDVVVAFAFSKKEIDTNKLVNDFTDMKFSIWASDRFEATRSDVNKAVNVEKALAMLNVLPQEAICFGDGINDIEMFNLCGISVAMGNSKDEVKKQAKYICSPVNESGIYQMLKQLKII